MRYYFLYVYCGTLIFQVAAPMLSRVTWALSNYLLITQTSQRCTMDKKTTMRRLRAQSIIDDLFSNDLLVNYSIPHGHKLMPWLYQSST